MAQRLRNRWYHGKCCHCGKEGMVYTTPTYFLWLTLSVCSYDCQQGLERNIDDNRGCEEELHG